ADVGQPVLALGRVGGAGGEQGGEEQGGRSGHGGPFGWKRIAAGSAMVRRERRGLRERAVKGAWTLPVHGGSRAVENGPWRPHSGSDSPSSPAEVHRGPRRNLYLRHVRLLCRCQEPRSEEHTSELQ